MGTRRCRSGCRVSSTGAGAGGGKWLGELGLGLNCTKGTVAQHGPPSGRRRHGRVPTTELEASDGCPDQDPEAALEPLQPGSKRAMQQSRRIKRKQGQHTLLLTDDP